MLTGVDMNCDVVLVLYIQNIYLAMAESDCYSIKSSFSLQIKYTISTAT